MKGKIKSVAAWNSVDFAQLFPVVQGLPEKEVY